MLSRLTPVRLESLPLPNHPHHLHLDRHAVDLFGQPDAGLRGFAQVDLQAVAVADSDDPDAHHGSVAAEELEGLLLAGARFLDRGGFHLGGLLHRASAVNPPGRERSAPRPAGTPIRDAASRHEKPHRVAGSRFLRQQVASCSRKSLPAPASRFLAWEVTSCASKSLPALGSHFPGWEVTSQNWNRLSRAGTSQARLELSGRSDVHGRPPSPLRCPILLPLRRSRRSRGLSTRLSSSLPPVSWSSRSLPRSPFSACTGGA